MRTLLPFVRSVLRWLPVLVAGVMTTGLLHSILGVADLRFLRMLTVLAGAAFGAFAPASGIAAVVLSAATSGLLMLEGLRRGDVSLSLHLLIPLSLVALLRDRCAGLPSARVHPSASWAILMIVVLLSVARISAMAAMDVKASMPGLGWAPILETHVFQRLADAFSMGILGRPELPVLAAMRVLCVAAGGFLLFETTIASVSRDAPLRIIRSMTVGLLFACGVGIWQWFFPFNLDTKHLRFVQPNLFRIDSTMPDPNSLGCYLVLIAPVVVAAAWTSTGRRAGKAARAAAALTLTLTTLVLTGSRSAELGAVAAAAILALALAVVGARWRFSPVQRRRAIAVASAAVLLPLLAMVVVTTSGVASGINYHDADSRTDVLLFSLDLHNDPAKVVIGRGPLWFAAKELWMEHPLLGIGAGLYPSEKRRYPDTIDSWRGADNLYLEILAELGIVGLLALFAVFASAMRPLDSLARHGGPGERLAALAMAFGLVGLFASQLAQSWLWRPEAILLFAAVAALATLAAETVDLRPAGTAPED